MVRSSFFKLMVLVYVVGGCGVLQPCQAKGNKRRGGFGNLKLPGFTEDQKLTTYIDKFVRPKSKEMESLNEAVDKLVHYLHKFNEHVPGKDYRVKRTVKSGSLGKGTAVQNKVDIDIVVFLQKFTAMTQFLEELPEVISHLESYLWRTPNLRVDTKAHRYMVKCTLFHKGEEYSVDILPAVDLVEIEGGIEVVHRQMARLGGDPIEGPLSHYSVCFAEYQKKFIKGKADSNPKVKDLIRLVKFWSKENGLEKKAVSYCLELICIQVYQDYAGDRRFEMTDLFEKVLDKLVNIESLEIAFDDYYQTSKYRRSWTAPYVMDPANPFQNTLPQLQADRATVAKKAVETLGPQHGVGSRVEL